MSFHSLIFQKEILSAWVCERPRICRGLVQNGTASQWQQHLWQTGLLKPHCPNFFQTPYAGVTWPTALYFLLVFSVLPHFRYSILEQILAFKKKYVKHLPIKINFLNSSWCTFRTQQNPLTLIGISIWHLLRILAGARFLRPFLIKIASSSRNSEPE